MTKTPLVAVIHNQDRTRDVVSGVIRLAGFDVEGFASAEAFIRSNRMLHTGCLVVDVQLTGMTGLQLQSHLAAAGRHIPIIFMTSSADERTRALARELGAVSFHSQPAGEKPLLKEIFEVLKGTSAGPTSPAPSASKDDS